MVRVLIVADDLTGALDSAAGFAMGGMSVRVALDLDDVSALIGREDLDVLALATGTRELHAAEATAKLARLVGAVGTFGGVKFKKIDSRLKGHIAAELAELRRLRPDAPVIASPAIPKLGRFVRDGALCGAAVASPITIAPFMGCTVTVPEVASDADLDAALPDDPAAAVFVGAAGLAHALARRMAKGRTEPLDLPSPLLLAVGSRDPVSLAQVAQSGLSPIPAPNGLVPFTREQDACLVQMVAGDAPVTGPVAGRRFASDIASIIRQGTYRSLFACGGETAQAILENMGIRQLDLRGEVLDGVPVARAIGADLTVVTKSGGFGAPDLLSHLLNKFAKRAAAS